MGTYNHTYVGIYLEVPFTLGTVTESFYVHPETKKRQKAKFDAQTGRENELKTETRNEYHEPSSYINDVEGLDEAMFFTPAYTSGGKRIQTFLLNGDEEKTISYDGDGLFNFDVSDLNIPKILEEFKIKYKPYLDYYTEQFGEYEIKYGVVNYAH